MSGMPISSGLSNPGQLVLDVAHGVVTEIAGQAAAEAREAGAHATLKRAWYCSTKSSGLPSWRFDDLAVGDHFGDDLRWRAAACVAGRPMKE
jgi:hypothetical protein